MMMDPRIDKLADVLVNYSVAVRPGDRVAIEGTYLAEPLLKAVYVKALKAGGHPFPMIAISGMRELLFKHGSDEQIQHVSEPRKLIMETYDVRISLSSSENTKALSNADPKKSVLFDRAHADLWKTMINRMASGEMRWVGTQFPTNAHAQDAEMSLAEYEEFVFGACLPDLDDPIGYWQRFSARQRKIVDWFKGKRKVRVIAKETDLSMSIEGRVFINCDGHENMPDGEIFTGPVEDSVEGAVSFSYPTDYDGREVTGVHLEFEAGQVVKASATKNEDYLLKTLDTDNGSRRVGEFAIGTNEGITRFTHNTLFDEKIGGTFHLALGASLPESGGKNESAIHWDMVNGMHDGGEIWVDDELIYKDGKFLLTF
jgi:aminopeptidase